MTDELTEFRFAADGDSWTIPASFDTYELLYRKLPLSEQERKDLEASIDTAAGKVVTKMIFGLRDTLETDAFIDCVEGLEKVYEE